MSLKNNSYDKQYFQLYQHRLNELRDRVNKNYQKEWNDKFKIEHTKLVKKEKVLDIQAGELCWCVGTIYCEMKYKPNILDEVVNDIHSDLFLGKGYMDPEGSDEIMLEDESGRVVLVGDLVKNTLLITGIVIGVVGMETNTGTFKVLDIVYPIPLFQKPLRIYQGKKLALISGLNITSTDHQSLLRLQLLQDILIGSIGNVNVFSQIARCIICGNSINSQGNSIGIQESLNEFENFLTNILKSLPIDLIPGESDPSNKTLPQQPFNKALFSCGLKPYFQSTNQDLFGLMTNPYTYDMDGLKIFVTSGQTINDICKYVTPYNEDITKSNKCTIESRLDFIEATLKWQNIAPTAPDTLWCYPYKKNDPFILNELPHVYIVGNQPSYASRVVKLENGNEVVIITVPEFKSSGEVVIFDLETLNSTKFQISV